MGTTFRLSVVKSDQHPGKPWKVEIPASITGTVRKRRFFAYKLDAQNWAQDFVEETLQGGVKATEGGQSVSEVLADFLAQKRATVGIRQWETLSLLASRVREAIGARPVVALKFRDIEKVMNAREGWSARTRWNVLAFTRTFLNWCRRRDLIERNPADLMAEEVSRPEAEISILTPLEMRLLLHVTKREPVMRAFVVLGGFSGLRSAELMRIQWEDVNVEEREIHVRPGVIKKTRGVRERYTVLNATAVRWLPSPGKGSVVPYTQRKLQLKMVKIAKRMKAILSRLRKPEAERWSEWPHNCLRHSFASYLLSLKEDAPYVAFQMGHTSPAMVQRVYAKAVRRSEAEAWWKI